MRLVFMNGGLGNQAFQYIFLRWLELYAADTCLVEDSAFFGPEAAHNGFELTRVFGVRPRRLSSYFVPELWQQMLADKAAGISIPQQLRSGRFFLGHRDLSLVHEGGSIAFDGPGIKVKSGQTVPLSAGDVYYHGYWLGDFFYRQIEAVMQRELQFPPLPENTWLGDLARGLRAGDAAAVHVRRGDMARVGWSAGPAYFAGRVAELEARASVRQYLVFSDDLPWCQEHRQELGLAGLDGRVLFVEGNRGEEAYRDMQLMSLCRWIIGDRSSFSWLAGILSQVPGKELLMNWKGEKGNG